MRKIKCLSIALLILAACLVYSPHASIAGTVDKMKETGEMSKIKEINEIREMNETDRMNESDKSTGKSRAIDDKMLVSPKYNCDPGMLVPADPNIDPGFLLYDLSTLKR